MFMAADSFAAGVAAGRSGGMQLGHADSWKTRTLPYLNWR